jgi:hypothetical protein
VTTLSKKDKTICAVSGLLHDGKVYFKRTADGKLFHEFSCIAANKDLLYVGATNGSVYVFESTTGNFFKEIPFQTSLFASLRLDDYCSGVKSIKVN